MNKKVIVITGTSSGIGLELAQFFTSKGAIVYGLSRTQLSGVSFFSTSTDITKEEEVKATFKKIYDNEGRIDVLINNAGKGMVGPIEDASQDEIISLFTLNVIGSKHTIAAAMPYFRNKNQGKIINISSIGSIMGLPFRGYYSASKSALDMVTEALRYEIKPFGVQACVLHLGDIKTNIADNRINGSVSQSYKTTFNKVFEGMNTHVDKGTEPKEISIFIEKLLNKKNLKPHYYFGKNAQKLSVLLKKILPQLVFEKMIRKYSHL